MDFRVNLSQFYNSQGSIHNLCSEVDTLHIPIAKLKDEVIDLKQKLLLMQLRKYGTSSEKKVGKYHQGANLFGEVLTGGEASASPSPEDTPPEGASPSGSASENTSVKHPTKPPFFPKLLLQIVQWLILWCKSCWMGCPCIVR